MFEPFQKLVINDLEEEIVITDFKQHNLSRAIGMFVFFPKPHNKLVVFTHGFTIFETLSFTPIKKDLNDEIYDAIRWGDSFMFCAFEGIRIFSIIEPFKEIGEVFKPENTENSMTRIQKINDSLFVVKDTEHHIIVVDFKTQKAVKKYFLGIQYSSQTEILRSKKYESCIYVPVKNDKKESVVLVQAAKGIILKTFKGHSDKDYVEAITTFESVDGHEILVVCDTSETIYFYNTSSNIFDTNTVAPVNGTVSLDFSGIPNNKIYCVKSFQNRYLCCGGSRSNTYLYKIVRNQLFKLKAKFVLEKRRYAYEEGDNDVVDIIESNGNYQLVVGGSNGIFTVSNVKGLDISLRSKQELLDENERIEFLFEERESYYFDENERKGQSFTLKLHNLDIQVGLKLLFY